MPWSDVVVTSGAKCIQDLQRFVDETIAGVVPELLSRYDVTRGVVTLTLIHGVGTKINDMMLFHRTDGGDAIQDCWWYYC